MSKNKRNISLIVLHCSATRVNQNFTIEQLEACHKARGFQTVGYHYYITKDGTLYPGRPESQMGAHAKGFNAHSIGICYEGGLDANGKPSDTRTPQQKVTLRKLLAELRKKYPSSVILGHHDLDTKKACPCFSISEYADLQP